MYIIYIYIYICLIAWLSFALLLSVLTGFSSDRGLIRHSTWFYILSVTVFTKENIILVCIFWIAVSVLCLLCVSM